MDTPLTTQQGQRSVALRPKGGFLDRLQAATGEAITARTDVRTVYLVIDCSGSMSGDNKLKHASNGAFEFAKQAYVKGYNVGLIRFSSSPVTVLSATRDSSALEVGLASLSTGGSTDMAGGIETGVRELKEVRGGRVLYIVTDGQPDDRNATLAAAERAKLDGIEIMTLGTDDADRDFLAQLASRTELSAKVERAQLQRSISDMARFLLSDKR